MKLSQCILVAWVIMLNLGLVEGQKTKSNHRLLPTPQTITWGYFDARTPPVLRIRSGDVVEMTFVPPLVAHLCSAPLQLSDA